MELRSRSMLITSTYGSFDNCRQINKERMENVRFNDYKSSGEAAAWSIFFICDVVLCAANDYGADADTYAETVF